MNVHLYEFNKYELTGITLVASQQDYVLSNSTIDSYDGTKIVPYRESQAYLVKTSDSTREHLVYIPWRRFSERVGSAIFANSDMPEIYSLRNVDNDGKASLWPTPSTSIATDYTLTIEIYRRIPLISALTGDGSQPNVPEEVETPLIYNACKRMAIHLYGPGHEDVGAYDALEKRAINELKSIDKRHPDQQQRFRLVDSVNHGTRRAGRRSLYIKV